MSTPAVYIERWPTPPAVPAYCPAGAAGGVATGTEQTWNMAGGFAGYPRADRYAEPPSMFRVYDLADPREIVRVSHNSAGGDWQVVRGDQGSRIVAHAPGFTVWPVITAEALAGLAQGTPSGDGLGLEPSGMRYAWDAGPNSRAIGTELIVPAREAYVGSAYEATCWGWYSPAAGRLEFSCGLDWNGEGRPVRTVGQLTYPLLSASAGARWRLHSMIEFARRGAAIDATATTHAWFATSNNPAAEVQATMVGPTYTPFDVPLDVLVRFRPWVQINSTSCLLRMAGGWAWRAA